MQPGHLDPARLPAGTRVGRWRLREQRGWGAYGAVYRAFDMEGIDRPVALKLALHPEDLRFAREVELLSRLRHPSVPRLVDHGSWQHPGGLSYPYLAMEWIEGMALYEWALARRPTSRQVLRALASLARALEATHAAGGVHRDVKGDNVLVSTADGRVFLTDFGSGHYMGAATLTSPPFPPGTPPYRSPEAWRSVKLPFPASAPPYAPGPADDVFALGMTAYRLVTGEYPPPTAPMGEARSVWSLEGMGPPHPRIINVRCCGELSGLVSRMLSVHSEARGSAREMAEALEQAARKAGPDADTPLFAQEPFQPLEARNAFRHVVHRASRRGRQSRILVASLGGVVALGVGWMLGVHRGEEAEQRHASSTEDAKDGGTVAVGDAALTAPMPVVQAPSAWSTISVDLPPRPLPGQTRPNAAGHCPHRGHIVIQGGCWVKVDMSLKNCDDGYYVYKGACYGPVFPPVRPSTSGPTERSGDDAQ